MYLIRFSRNFRASIASFFAISMLTVVGIPSFGATDILKKYCEHFLVPV
jgi:hypothetical protein